MEELLPTPDDPDEDESDNTRIWIGNIDERITEFTMLKLLQKYGSLKKFDFLYITSGPEKGKSRGYCFATYSKSKEAVDAIKSLNGKRALFKRLVVKYATAKSHDTKIQSISQHASFNVQKKAGVSNVSNKVKINAIEAKLKLMTQSEDNHSSSLSSSSSSIQVKRDDTSSSSSLHQPSFTNIQGQERNAKRHTAKRHYFKPYHKS